MLYSRSAEYAIRAFVNLAQVPDGRYAMVKQIAAEEEIPAQGPHVAQRRRRDLGDRVCEPRIHAPDAPVMLDLRERNVAAAMTALCEGSLRSATASASDPARHT